jgi:hypothetical protein
MRQRRGYAPLGHELGYFFQIIEDFVVYVPSHVLKLVSRLQLFSVRRGPCGNGQADMPD